MGIKHDKTLGPIGRSAYVKGCRCNRCGNANTEYHRNRRDNKRAESVGREPAGEPGQAPRTVARPNRASPAESRTAPASVARAEPASEPADDPGEWFSDAWSCDNCGRVARIFEDMIDELNYCPNPNCRQRQTKTFRQECIEARMPGWVDNSIENPIGKIQTDYNRMIEACERQRMLAIGE
jgi:hypothetical protein